MDALEGGDLQPTAEDWVSGSPTCSNKITDPCHRELTTVFSYIQHALQ